MKYQKKTGKNRGKIYMKRSEAKMKCWRPMVTEPPVVGKRCVGTNFSLSRYVLHAWKSEKFSSIHSLTIVLRSRPEYLLLNRRGRRPSWLKLADRYSASSCKFVEMIVSLFNKLSTKYILHQGELWSRSALHDPGWTFEKCVYRGE